MTSSAAADYAWQLAARLAMLLERPERDVVWGDLLECRATGIHALREITGVVIRRQLEAWMRWQPWMALVAVAVPFGVLLAFISRWWAHTSAVFVYLYSGRMNWDYLQHPAARGDFLEFAATLALDCAALAGWSWTCGIVLGTLARQARWTTATICVALVFAATIGTPTTARVSGFFLSSYPALLRIAFVVAPLVRGVWCSGRLASLRRWRMLAAAATIVALTVFETRGIEGALTFGAYVLPPAGPDGIIGSADDGRPLRLLPLVMAWPAIFVAVQALRRGASPRSQSSPRSL